MRIERLTGAGARRLRGQLAALLADAVRHGASIGYTLPLEKWEVMRFWEKTVAEVKAGSRVLLGAFNRRGRLVGTAQLALETRSNGRHRAEVQKVLVEHAARGGGLGTALMLRLELEARLAGRTLLFLDTSEGAGGAVQFYRGLRYIHIGGIPDYAADPDGRLRTNAIFYKRLPIR